MGMNVTFLIGNGFDLACGLRTSYTDFLEYYLKLQNDNENIIFFKNYIERDLSTWADAETAFGDYTKRYNIETVSAYRECYDDFIQQLSVYLGLQENRINIPNLPYDAFSAFRRGLENFDSSLPEDSKDKLIEMYNKSQFDERNICTLTFNYTSIFEKLLDTLSNSPEPGIQTTLINGEECVDFFNNTVYVHGDRRNPPLVFGVDNDTQVTNKDLLTLPRFARSLIKPDANIQVRNKVVQRCIDTIKISSVICIYGMSLGLTDTIWWKRILEWLLQDTSNQLVYFAWAPDCVKDSVGSYTDTIDDCREHVFGRLLLSASEAVLLHDQIHIAINVDLFGADRYIRPYCDRIKDDGIPF